MPSLPRYDRYFDIAPDVVYLNPTKTTTTTTTTTLVRQALCNGDYLRPLQLEVWDWDRDGDHDCMGRLTSSLQGLLEGQGREMDLEVRRGVSNQEQLRRLVSSHLPQ